MENVFNINYHTGVDKLKFQKEKKTTKLLKFIQKHKFFSIIFTSFFILAGLNFYLIYSFMKILENI